MIPQRHARLEFNVMQHPNVTCAVRSRTTFCSLFQLPIMPDLTNAIHDLRLLRIIRSLNVASDPSLVAAHFDLSHNVQRALWLRVKPGPRPRCGERLEEHFPSKREIGAARHRGTWRLLRGAYRRG